MICVRTREMWRHRRRLLHSVDGCMQRGNFKLLLYNASAGAQPHTGAAVLISACTVAEYSLSLSLSLSAANVSSGLVIIIR